MTVIPKFQQLKTVNERFLKHSSDVSKSIPGIHISGINSMLKKIYVRAHKE